MNTEEETEDLIKVSCEIATKINFAAHQNAFALLRSLQVGCPDNSPGYESLALDLTSDPSFLKPKTWKLDRLKPREIVVIKDRDVELSGEYLKNLTDSVAGKISFTLRQGETVLARCAMDLELLAHNEWGGSRFMPELLAAFSLPNDPAIDQIIHDASKILRAAGKKDGIDGYGQKSRQRVWEIASAIYAAVANRGITYALPPASFETNGQKIRLPSQILTGKVATCLDSTMLFAAAFEQAGLNPVVVMPKGHALVGVWLQPEELSTIVVDEPEILRKRIQLNEIILVETTLALNNSAPSFSKAIEAGVQTIPPDLDESFTAAVDIRKARAHKIRPLGTLADSSPLRKPDEHNAPTLLGIEDAPELPDFDHGLEAVDTEREETPSGRLERWQRKLLDLSATNPLLNHRGSKASLNFICPDPGLLEDKLAAGERITLQAIQGVLASGQDEEIHRQRTGELISREYALDALSKKQLLVGLSPEELASRAVEIYRKAQASFQEGGANTLYLALGFLLWKHTEKDNRRFRAPLILLPVVLDRKSARSGYTLTSHDDEARINTTLLEMLRQDFQIDIQGLDASLPTDQSGIDVKGIWDRVRLAIKSSAGFEVVEDVVLGNFSFAKYLMWKDLVDRADELRKCPIVRHLIDTPREAYPSRVSFVPPAELDKSFAPSDLLTPLQADSSQMSVIATADRGKDFIVIGPPGTGKSQTISNLIAHMLGKGKTVLFVAEKTAALDVVHRRLDDVGLGRFCLELHSNKARKADVLDQLRKTWEHSSELPPALWERESNRLKEARDKLDRVADALHKRYANGLTPYQAAGVKIRDEAYASRVSLAWPSSREHDENQLEAMRETARTLGLRAAELRSLAVGSLSLVGTVDWSPNWESEVVETAEHLSEACSALEQAADALLSAIGVRIAFRDFQRLDSIADLADLLLECWRKPCAFALEPDGRERIEALEEAVVHLKSYSQLQAALSCPYEPFAWRKIDGVRISERWRAASTAWWPKSIFAKSAIRKELVRNGAKGTPDPGQDASILKALHEEGTAIDRLDQRLASLGEWRGHETTPEAAESLGKFGLRVRQSVGRLAESSEELQVIQGKVKILVGEGNELLAPDAAVGMASKGFGDALKRILGHLDRMDRLCGQRIRDLFERSSNPLGDIRGGCAKIVSNRIGLKDWCAWMAVRAKACELGLAPLVESIEQGVTPPGEALRTFEAAYCTWWSRALIGEDDVLRTFSAAEHDDTVRRYRELDSRFQRLTASYISAKLCAAIPGQEGASRSSGWGVLRREIQKKSRHKPIRQLVQEIPEVLSSLAPCLMMSPLSVAQYLPSDRALFDLVIFDEASQITVWDAVGALARGRQVVVAGDPRQMPPTNFFARSGEESDSDIDQEDLESILDELDGASIPRSTLNLHYRSRRESLIAFSNNRYYENALVTFPAPASPDRGIRLVRPDGFYARGGARHNEGEGKAVVAEILRRLQSPDPKVRNASIGVVTFNSEQQTLIENLLDEARSRNPDIEWAFSRESVLEPVFVKNLETVQGDERDVILFSITYGPDLGGAVTMNFGPLNRTGGERRLNVALTRARSEMVVFSTLTADRLDLSRTQARAVLDLKHFLEYAERGPSALGAAAMGSLGDLESPFEEAVADRLRRKGWTIHPQVGVSSYRIDLGIVHPDHPGAYLAGVECDGATYHSSSFARERDKIRQNVLEGLGWKLVRLWSTHWWNNPGGCLESLDAKLKELLELDRKERVAREQEETESEAAVQPAFLAEPPVVASATAFPTAAIGDSLMEEKSFSLAAKQVMIESPPAASSGMAFGTSEYRNADLDNGRFPAEPDMFQSPEYAHQLELMIGHVIEFEGPVHEDVLVRRIARHHGFQRSGNLIRGTVVDIADKIGRTTMEPVGKFYWPASADVTRPPARCRNRDDEMRNVEYICQEEIRAIDAELSTGKDPVELARAMGIARLAKVSRARLCMALGLSKEEM